MKTKLILITTLMSLSLTSICKTWTIVNSSSSFNFSPSTLTITIGDDVNFDLESIHNAREVSQSTWNANGTSALSGGFATAFGGGTILPEKLTVGTHYYVCTTHVSSGMKGTIIVQNISSIQENSSMSNLLIFRQSSNGILQLELNNESNVKNSMVNIINLQGKTVYKSEITNSIAELDLRHQSSGIYIIKIQLGQSIITRKFFIR